MRNSSNSRSTQSETVSVDVLLGRAAMVGFVLAFGIYLTADVVTPGLI